RASAFLGFHRTWVSASTESSSHETMIGRRPMNSGIMPYLTRSSVRAWARSASLSSSAVPMAAPKPRPRSPTRRRTMSSMPLKAPVQMNRMSVVSIWMRSCCGRVRAPSGGVVGGDGRGLALEDLEQGLLHALARDVARRRGHAALARDLVDLVDADDAARRALDVAAGVAVQGLDDRLHVLADVAGLGERGR